MTNKEQARQFVAYLFGYLAAKDFDGMPVTEAGQYSLFVGSPDRGAVIMAEGASIFDWLHEATHYLCWLWFDGLRKDELTPAEEHRAELAAYLPAAVLEAEGSAAARVWLNAAWETTAARARRIVFDSEVPLKAQMRRLIDGAKTKLTLASFDLPSYENEDRLPTLREMYANLRKKARPQAPEYATLTENTNIDDPDTW